ncbi:MAG: Gfo/Idh/MocA family oxidoreductase, partial [Rhodospirillaceae bacterium]
MPEPLRVLIVGCGDIAGGYDEKNDDRAVRTHAGAYARDGRFAVAACIDPDAARRAAFMAHWGVPEGFADLEACRAAGGAYDVASVCVPTAHHGAALETLLEMPLKAVLAEKPLTGDLENSRAVVAAYAAAGRPLAVNFLRRFDAEIQRLKAEIAAGEWGAVQAASALYAKGLVNCGSHAVDLLQYLIGPLAPEAVTDVIDDHTPADPTVSARLRTTAGAPVDLVGVDSRGYF